MAKKTAVDYRAKTEDELEAQLVELRKEQFNLRFQVANGQLENTCLLYTSPSPRDMRRSRMPSSA